MASCEDEVCAFESIEFKSHVLQSLGTSIASLEGGQNSQSNAHNASDGAVARSDGVELHMGDYVGFERVSPDRAWHVSLGKVISFPSSRTVKVALYDAVSDTSVKCDPRTEEKIRKAAEEGGKMQLWNDREALREELQYAEKAEKEASEQLFHARDVMLRKQQMAGEPLVEVLEALYRARQRVLSVPASQWRDMRTPVPPSPGMVALMRAVMTVLHEDRAKKWDDIHKVMRKPDFMARLMSMDCAATPLTAPRSRTVVTLCNVTTPKKGKSRGSVSQASIMIPPAGADTGATAILDAALREWLNAQIACSEAAKTQEAVLTDSLAEQQAQRAQLREVNDMRVNISRIEMQMHEARLAITGADAEKPKPRTLMPISEEGYPTDVFFYKRTYPQTEGRFVQEVILRDAVLMNFGPTADEDAEGYVRLRPEQIAALFTAVRRANVQHDADEMEELLARKSLQEQEIAELRARITELRAKGYLTPEEEEELAQLEKILEEAERFHSATLDRISELYAEGRGAREIIMALPKPDDVYTRLHCAMGGDWENILKNEGHVQAMIVAFRSDVAKILGIPMDSVMDIVARNGSLQLDFTVRHSGELDMDELQELINAGDFSSLCMFYEKVTFKKTSPINSPAQRDAYRAAHPLACDVNYFGMGLQESLSDYYDLDGSLKEGFDEDIISQMDYRKACITIPIVRCDYDDYVIVGADELYVEDQQAVSLNAIPQEPAEEKTITTVAARGLVPAEEPEMLVAEL